MDLKHTQSSHLSLQTFHTYYIYSQFLPIRNFSPYCQNKTRLKSIGLRKSILGISFSPDLKMAEYKIVEIVSIDLR